MASDTKIEWTDSTWNPATGCSVVSPGCTNCYAMRLAGGRLRHHPSRAGLTAPSKAGPVWNGKISLNHDWLDQPLHWKEPRRIFVCAHGDLFHEGVPSGFIDRVFAVMALSPQHTFQVLTKRPERMRAYLSGSNADVAHWHVWRVCQAIDRMFPWRTDGSIAARDRIASGAPLPNVWLGTSVENQEWADRRHGDLAALAAAGWNTFVSYEPALGPVDWRGWGFLRWLISGGESGPKARPSHPDWHRAARQTLDRPLSRTEAKVAEIIGLSYGGIYNAPIAFKRHWRPFLGGRAVEIVARSNRLSTFDFDGLTKLVLLSHEARIRFEISTHTRDYFKLAFSQRSAAGGMSQRHPNIDEAVAALRAWLPADHAVIFRPDDAGREHSDLPAAAGIAKAEVPR